MMRGNMKIFKYALLIVFVTVVGLSAQDISFQLSPFIYLFLIKQKYLCAIKNSASKIDAL